MHIFINSILSCTCRQITNPQPFYRRRLITWITIDKSRDRHGIHYKKIDKSPRINAHHVLFHHPRYGNVVICSDSNRNVSRPASRYKIQFVPSKPFRQSVRGHTRPYQSNVDEDAFTPYRPKPDVWQHTTIINIRTEHRRTTMVERRPERIPIYNVVMVP